MKSDITFTTKTDHQQAQTAFMPFAEFVALMVSLMSLSALCIDAMLPMLGAIGKDMQVENANHVQYVISAMLLGLALGQLIYGPLSDNYGRKTMVYIGMLLFSAGSAVSLLSGNFQILLIGRVLQGFGAASSRIVTVSMVRDRYSGRDMARVMSIIMGTFIFVPMVAPAIGQVILIVGHWRYIFAMFLIIATINVAWMHFRLSETLPRNKRKPFRFRVLWNGIKEVMANHITRGYIICAGLVFGGLVGYLTSARQIFQEYYDTGEWFAIYFSGLALAAGCASFLNSRIVKRFGMRLIARYAFIVMAIASTIFVAFCLYQSAVPLPVFMLYAVITFFCMGLLFGNINAIAMEPMGHIAGVASAVIGASSSAISLIIGGIIGLSFNMTLLPLGIGFLLTSAAGFLIQRRVERR